jgi:hypothetical protein
MSVLEITPTDASLPPLGLPAGALSPTHSDYEHDVGSDPPEIEPIEHRLRVDFIDGGPITRQDLHRQQPPPLARRYVAQTLTDTYQSEHRYYATVPADERLVEAPAFLHDELAAHYEELNKIRQRRQQWYTELIPKNLDTIFRTVESLAPDESQTTFDHMNDWRGTVLVTDATSPERYANDHGLDEQTVIRESDLDDHTTPSAYGISLPAPLLVGEYHTHSLYSLIPWSDGLVCSCGYKQTKPWIVMCKHELAATIRLAQDNQYFLPVDAGIDVPQRARRFVSPTIARQHTPRMPATE